MSNLVKVLITDGMAKEGLEILNSQEGFEVDVRDKTSAEELGSIISNYHCIVIRSATTLTKELIEKADQMKLIVRAGAGVDNIDVETATAKKIPVMNTAAANSLAAAEQTIALMFSMLRMIPQAYASLKQGKWDRKSFKGYEATGKTLGLVGLGNIGKIVAEKAIGLGMNVVAFDPMISSLSQLPSSLTKQDESFTLVSSLDNVLSAANILTVHVPKNEHTAHMINSESLGKMKDGSFLLNCARGGVVDEQSVLNAVESGKLKFAAFDVFEKEPPEFSNPLFQHPNVICVPHLGASTHEAQTRVALTAANQMSGFFLNEEKTGVINNL